MAAKTREERRAERRIGERRSRIRGESCCAEGYRLASSRARTGIYCYCICVLVPDAAIGGQRSQKYIYCTRILSRSSNISCRKKDSCGIRAAVTSALHSISECYRYIGLPPIGAAGSFFGPSPSLNRVAELIGRTLDGNKSNKVNN